MTFAAILNLEDRNGPDVILYGVIKEDDILGDHAHLSTYALLRQSCQILSIQPDSAALRVIQPIQQPDNSALPAACLPH